MATPEVISLVVDKIVAAFGGDVDLFESWLVRSRLATELEALQSEQRNLQAAEDEQNQTFGDALVASQAAITAKQAEIDAL